MAVLKASVEVENLPAVLRALDRLGKTAERKIIRSAIRKSMKPMLNAAKQNAPVDIGLLKKSLTIRSLKRKRGTIGFSIGFKNVEAIVAKSSKNQQKKRWFYPAVIEYGGKNRQPKPFMRPAFESHKQEAVNVINKEVRAGITNWANRNRVK